MYIFFRGKPPKSIKKTDFIDAANWFSNQLLSRYSLKNVIIDVVFDPKLKKKKKLYGLVEPLDYGKRPKWYEIQIDSTMNKKNILVTLAHELVHVMQYRTGKLKEDMANGKLVWQKKLYSNGVGLPAGKELDEPWEDEAYKLELELYNDYRLSLR